MTTQGLLEAADVLDELVSGGKPERARLLSGALALEAFYRYVDADQNVLAAGVCLRSLAVDGADGLTAHDRSHASKLASAVRQAALTRAYQ